jgi:hypothetical protein
LRAVNRVQHAGVKLVAVIQECDSVSGAQGTPVVPTKLSRNSADGTGNRDSNPYFGLCSRGVAR